MVCKWFRANSNGLLSGADWSARCALGAGGVKPAVGKSEGDGATPAGRHVLRRVLYRPDREGAPRTALPVLALKPDDGWCDAPHDLRYNRPVKVPYAASAEMLWRTDHLYDLIVVLGHNDDPVIAGAGSAIFLHLAQPDWRATEGCVAVERETMLRILSIARPGDGLEIVRA